MYAVVQVRGVVNTRRDIKDTLKMLRLHHINHCVLVADTPENLGMIRKVKDYVAYGEVDAATLETLLSTRGRVIGDDPLTDEYIKSNSVYSSIIEFAQALAKGESRLRDIPGLKRSPAPPAAQRIQDHEAHVCTRRSAWLLWSGDQYSPL